MDFVDSYTNVTMDTVSGLKVALGWRWNHREPDFLVMGDDDTYINVPALWKLLFHDKVVKRVSRVYEYERSSLFTISSHLITVSVSKQIFLPSIL